MILQLNPSMLVETPLGRGHAIFLIDYGMHQNSCWVVALEKDGIVKHFDSNDIIISTNFTYHLNTEQNTTFNHADEDYHDDTGHDDTGRDATGLDDPGRVDGDHGKKK